MHFNPHRIVLLWQQRETKIKTILSNMKLLFIHTILLSAGEKQSEFHFV